MGGLIDLGDMVFHIVNVIVLFFFLRWLLYKPVVKFLKKREEKFSVQANDLDNREKNVEELKEKYETLIKGSKEEAADIVKTATTSANSRANDIMANAEREAQAMMLKSQKDIDEKNKQAMIELKADIADMACDLASRILKREINQEDNKKIIDDFFEKS